MPSAKLSYRSMRLLTFGSHGKIGTGAGEADGRRLGDPHLEPRTRDAAAPAKIRDHGVRCLLLFSRHRAPLLPRLAARYGARRRAARLDLRRPPSREFWLVLRRR